MTTIDKIIKVVCLMYRQILTTNIKGNAWQSVRRINVLSLRKEN